MSLVLTRVDDRLIHGQILETWVPFVRADCIVVANDEVAGNSLKKMMMQASVPSRMRVEIGTVEEIVSLLNSDELSQRRILLLFGTTADAVRAYRSGLAYNQLNLGNLHANKGKVRLSCTLFLNLIDVDNLELLEHAGVNITARCIPADGERLWRKMIPAFKEQD